nr:LytTR family transcriptional regulator DNA-binding domain-containing protein [Treponema sp.]
KGLDFEREWKSTFSDVAKELTRSSFASSFFCLRRGLLVNLSHVSRITRSDCIIDNEEVLPLSRGIYKELNEAFISYYKKV